MTLSGQGIGQDLVVTAYEHPVNEVETCYPVSVLQFSVMVLDIILTTCKVPHEVSPVHEVNLISQEELDVFCLCGYGQLDVVTALVVCNRTAFYASAP